MSLTPSLEIMLTLLLVIAVISDLGEHRIPNLITLSAAALGVTSHLYLGGLQVNDLTLFGRPYKVMVQAEPEFRVDPDNLKQIYVRSGAEAMVPIAWRPTTIQIHREEGRRWVRRRRISIRHPSRRGLSPRTRQPAGRRHRGGLRRGAAAGRCPATTVRWLPAIDHPHSERRSHHLF